MQSKILLRICLLGLIGLVTAMTDKATGLSFPVKKNDLVIFGVGARKKGPIKVYSVAMYCKSAVKEKLAAFSKSTKKSEALKVLRKEAKTHPTAFVLQMSFKVGAEKMASAIADSVTPRHTGNSAEVDALKALIFKGVSAKGAAVKGTTFQFDCNEKGIHVAVDGKGQGHVGSGKLAGAFCDVYLDEKCVSPGLRDSIIDNCCAP